ncbi:glycerophosphodiester phosphodiesterase [Desulfobotulus sp.]|uniref:glycerophosphodiester phosphodiesterase n=1 Tax=Desulfobotulus sp. TaxID=1940337 RepID=UPI002A36EB38|nr:glycerophosphodiester phosphodiesterase family protein [Desulfobotulus sp.]MDY0163218.1 glycerophosphodiester phosphodiesterase family protein [Desulfobotulus sp.]
MTPFFTVPDFPPSPLLIAHRGYRALFPENTLPAFEAAWEAGARMAELDILWSRDGHLMVHHDASLDRCTSGKGPLQEKKAVDLRLLDAGSWFSPTFSGTPIPFLDEVVASVPPGCWLNVEVKPEAVMGGRSMGKMTAALTAALRPLEGRVLISSFHHGFLRHLSNLADPPLLGVLSGRWKNARPLLRLCREIRAFSWHPFYGNLRPDHVLRMKAFGIRVYPYTVNASEHAVRLLSMGVDGFFSDDVTLFQKIEPKGI